MRSLHIATIVSNASMYDSMRASMAEVGFSEHNCRFTRFDNTNGNRFEPFALLRELATYGDEPYIALCHQDLLFGPLTSLSTLQGRIEDLESHHPKWAVAGCAGRAFRGQFVSHMDDPSGSYRARGLARSVLTLDEMFLILRRSRYPMPTPRLSGFHFYGTDVAINARLKGDRAYVIDFPLRHLSSGNFTSDTFKTARQEMASVLRQKLLVGLVGTTCDEFSVSCNPAIESLLQRKWIAKYLRRIFLGFIPRAGHQSAP